MSRGSRLYVRQLAEGLVRRGARVVVLCGRHDDTLPAREWIEGVDVHRLRPLARLDKGVLIPGLVPATARIARSADAVIPVLPLAEALVVRAVAGRRTLPLYVCDLRLADRPASRVVERIAAMSARAAIASSRRFCALTGDYAAASRVVGRYADRALEVRPPVDVDAFSGVDRVRARARLRIHPTARVVGFVGRLVAEKGIPVLAEAMRRVREVVAGAELVVAGEGDAVAGGGLGTELRALLADEPWVRFTGHLDDDDLPAFYSAVDVLALPSIDPLEAYGMVQVEAMLCGTPVVASDMPGVRVPITRTGMGRLAPPGDPGGLADALVAVLSRPQEHVRSREQVLDALPPGEPVDALIAAIRGMRGSVSTR